MQVRRIVRIVLDVLKFYGLLIHYIWLRIVYVYLHIKLYCFKLGGALLIEAMEIWYSFKTMSNENRVIMAACIAVSIYCLSLITLIRM